MSIDVMQSLEDAARGADMDHSKWPDILQVVLQRIDQIVHTEFPPVKIPIHSPAQAPSNFIANGASGSSAHATPPPRSPQATTIPVTPQPPAASEAAAAPAPSAATDPTAPSSPSVVPNSQPGGLEDEPASSRPGGAGADPNATPAGIASTPTAGPSSIEIPHGALPPPLLDLYEQIQGALHGPFGTIPPYTYQRLAELVLAPTAHYKTLPAYLRALDRILSVSSTADVYPLKVDSTPTPSVGSGAPLDGFMATSNGNTAMHETFNGAELTRIPWLRDMADGDHEAPGSEDGDMDAPGTMVDPSAHVGGPDGLAAGGGYGEGQQTTLVNGLSRNVPADSRTMQQQQQQQDGQARQPDDGDGGGGGDVVHARGPQEIGNEDIGPQHAAGGGMPGIVDLEAAVGRPGEGEIVPGSSVQVPEDRARSEAERETGAKIQESIAAAAAAGRAQEKEGEGEEKEDQEMTDEKSAEQKEAEAAEAAAS